MINSDNDNNRDEPMVFIVIAKAYETEGGEPVDLHVLLTAPDDDTAVRLTLNALSEEGFLEADLDQIGMITGAPDDHTLRLSSTPIFSYRRPVACYRPFSLRAILPAPCPSPK